MRFPYLLHMAAKSALNRKATLALLVASVCLSTVLLLGLERIRSQVRDGFVQSVSGTDLIVGARGSGMELMLYSVFHLGRATNNMGYDTARVVASLPEVAWAIPVSLGDSHKGYPVVATTADYFARYRYRRDKGISFDEGAPFANVFDVVLGHETARKLGYILGAKITLTHGTGGGDLAGHDDKPFQVTGILKPTGTPVDRTLFISLPAMTALHLDWSAGAPIPGFTIGPDQVRKFNLEPKSVTALLVGLESRGKVFAVQRRIAEYKKEPLQAVMPGVALDELWRMVDVGEKSLLLMSVLVTVTGLFGLVASILAGLEQRRREMAILRSLGARPKDVVILLAAESLIVMALGIVCGIAVLSVAIVTLGGAVMDRYGISVALSLPTARELAILGGMFAAGFLAGLIPALKAYRISLADGLNASV